MVTLAPEAEGGDALAAAVLERGAVAAIGHSDATAEESERAFAAGMRHATHLWNAMPPLGHRAPGVVGAVLESPNVTAELVCDGHHLDRRVVALTVHRLGPHRVCLVTDAMAAAGLGDGTYRLGDLEATVVGGVARAPDGVLAGSTLMLDTAVQNIVAWGVASVPWAHAMASSVPARVIAAEGFGSLGAGSVATLVAVGDDGALAPLTEDAPAPG
jgi:N-acetylglucosamine-6-phosphate deacetylase